MQNRKNQLAFLLPNLLTASSVFLGVLSIIASSKGLFEKSALLLFIALILDGLDGRVARLTNTTSKFGLEFDSLADIISFGIAPAMMLYFYAGYEFNKFGASVTAIYVVLGTIRLARFNVTTENNEPSVFIGLPIPTAAMFVVFSIMFFNLYDLKDFSLILLFLTLIVSVLMVSNIRYPSFKKAQKEKINIFKILIITVMLSSLIYIFPIEGIFLLMLSYILFGIIRAIYNMITRKVFKNRESN